MTGGGRGEPKGRGSGSGGRPARQRPAEEDVDLRVQLPYFLARLAALVVITVVLALVGVNLVLALLLGFAVAGLLTWPLGRMQRRAARRAAQTDGERERRPHRDKDSGQN
jgi:Flp pilus assembly protein TadB